MSGVCLCDLKFLLPPQDMPEDATTPLLAQMKSQHEKNTIPFKDTGFSEPRLVAAPANTEPQLLPSDDDDDL